MTHFRLSMKLETSDDVTVELRSPDIPIPPVLAPHEFRAAMTEALQEGLDEFIATWRQSL